jgi:hypothetical protein
MSRPTSFGRGYSRLGLAVELHSAEDRLARGRKKVFQVGYDAGAP